MNAEQQLLLTLVRTCQALRTPRRKSNNVEMAIAASRWEKVFRDRQAELEKAPAKQKRELLAA